MGPHMALSNEIVREVRQSLGLTIDQVSYATGFSKSHCHAIELGFRVASPEFLAGLHRVALRMAGDLRIIQLIDSRIGHLAIPQTQDPQPPGCPMELILAEIEANKQQATMLEYLYRIARDGRVDESDDTAIANYLKHSNDLICLHQRSAAAIMQLREKCGGAK